MGAMKVIMSDLAHVAFARTSPADRQVIYSFNNIDGPNQTLHTTIETYS